MSTVGGGNVLFWHGLLIRRRSTFICPINCDRDFAAIATCIANRAKPAFLQITTPKTTVRKITVKTYVNTAS